MEVLEFAPRSPEWHAARDDAWTASLAATLAVPENARALQKYAAAQGVTLHVDKLISKAGIKSFFGNTLWTVWAAKVGRIPRFKGNDHTARGVTHEEGVIMLFERDTLAAVKREVTAIASKEKSWLLASFDGVVPASSDPSEVAPNGFPLEAKCPAFQSRKKLFDSKKRGKPAIMGLPYYWCQVQHQILVADAPYGWFVAAGHDEKTNEYVFPVIEKVYRDDEFLEQYEAAAQYYYQEFLYMGAEPPRLLSDEQLLRDLADKAAFDLAMSSHDIEGAAELYFAAQAAEKSAIEVRKALEAKLVAAARDMRKAPGTDEESVELAGLLTVNFAKAASVSWQKVAAKLAPSGIPEELIKECTGTARESVKVKQVEA